MKAKLFAVPASHPSACAEAALVLKGVPYRRVDLIPLLHKLPQRVRFGRPTVPGVILDGERVAGSREILRRLEALVPEPALYPAKGALLLEVEGAERWGEEVLQPAARRLTYASLRRQGGALRSYFEGVRLILPTFLVMMSRGPSIALGARLNAATDENVRRDLRELPSWLDRIDDWIEAGVLGGPEPNAADLQVGASLRLLLTLGDLQPLLEGRPAAALARRHFAHFPGEVPAGALQPDWLPEAAR